MIIRCPLLTKTNLSATNYPPTPIFVYMKDLISFKNDYSEGAHPRILELLVQHNLQQEAGYGYDSISEAAKGFIKQKLNRPEAAVYFVSGGTQANLLVISHLLKPYESVIAADSGHIHVHETGAIEYTGHKINTVAPSDGKLTVAAIAEVLALHTDEHMVKPAMVYISQSTEMGSIYSKAELQALSAYCKAQKLLLFIDGARMAVALTARQSDVSLADLGTLCDVFYLGATKNGGLLGEAIVFNDPNLADGFSYALKQCGALMAKGRLLGTQFYALFEGDLFLELGRHANRLAEKMADALQQCGYSFAIAPVSNQLFPILPYSLIHALAEDFGFYIWEQRNEQEAVVRLVTSWATAEEHIDLFIERLRELSTQEFVILVDENEQAIGSMEKLEAHVKNLKHRAFSVFLFDGKGDLILQQRAAGKYHSPGLWTNACCGHPRPGESTLVAAQRRTFEELGIQVSIEEVFALSYAEELANNLWENEFDHVFIGTYNQAILQPNPEEISALKSVSIAAVQQDIQANPSAYTFWFKKIIPLLHDFLKTKALP